MDIAQGGLFQPGELPEFDAVYRDPLPPFYFHHIIDPAAATLRVEVLGPNLTYTFRHDRAKELRLSASTISSRLQRKTTGFLALHTDKGKKRVVIAWAESGNGAGRAGDLLDVDSSVLANDMWTQRVISMGKMLGLRMRRPFDGRLSATMGRDMTGIFLGGHVEAKLAVHAVFTMLRKFDITQDLDNVSLRHLKGLRQARWNDGSRPSFEIYFSRKNCGFCGKFVRRLQKATGIPLRLIWRDRLVKMVYDQKPLRKMGPTSQPQQQQQQRDVVEIDIDDVETFITDITDEVRAIELVDLSGDHCSVVAEIINLTDDNDNDNNIVNIDLTDSGSPEQESHGHAAAAAADTYFDGLAYCVGQIEQCPAGAQAAILELAEKLARQRNAVSRRAALENVSKPLPATPQMAPPGYTATTAAATNRAVSAETDADIIAQALGGQASLGHNPLPPTPPSSGHRRDLGRANGGRPRASLDGNGTGNFHPEAPQMAETSPSHPPRTRLGLKRDAQRASLGSGNQVRAKRAAICVELPSRRCSSSPDPF